MLDAITLRVAFLVVALTLLTLSFFVTYRSTRSAYSLWWSIGLALLLAGNTAFILNGTAHETWANPLGNLLAVAGGASIWTATRSLRGLRVKAWQLAVPPLVTGGVSVVDDLFRDWSGTALFLGFMALWFGLAARELLQTDASYVKIRRPLVVAFAVLGLYYLVRMVVYITGGPSGFFTTGYGVQVSTLILLVLLVGVSFSMASLSSDQLANVLRASANRTGRELEQAAQVQRNLLPHKPPELPGFEVAGAVVPSGTMSGDFFDWQQTRDGLALTVGDVMGKGFGAAVIAATLRGVLRATTRTAGALTTVATADAIVQADLDTNEAFVTMFHARLRADGRLTVLDAGHGLAVLVRADGRHELMRGDNPPIGMVPEQRWTTATYQLEPGDLMLVFSDGVLDLFDGTLHAVTRAADVAGSGVSAERAVERIIRLATDVHLDDDVTVMAVRRLA
jgi:serine phosphatase RsbU (regulator of sigma subunit)